MKSKSPLWALSAPLEIMVQCGKSMVMQVLAGGFLGVFPAMTPSKASAAGPESILQRLRQLSRIGKTQFLGPVYGIQPT